MFECVHVCVQKRENISHQNGLRDGKKAAESERTNQYYMIKYFHTQKLRE